MVKQLKTLNVAQGGYEAPRCKVYSLTVESVIAQSPGYGGKGAPGQDPGIDDDDNNYGGF